MKGNKYVDFDIYWKHLKLTIWLDYIRFSKLRNETNFDKIKTLSIEKLGFDGFDDGIIGALEISTYQSFSQLHTVKPIRLMLKEIRASIARTREEANNKHAQQYINFLELGIETSHKKMESYLSGFKPNKKAHRSEEYKLILLHGIVGCKNNWNDLELLREVHTEKLPNWLKQSDLSLPFKLFSIPPTRQDDSNWARSLKHQIFKSMKYTENQKLSFEKRTLRNINFYGYPYDYGWNVRGDDNEVV
jgi:hypothetical protein